MPDPHASELIDVGALRTKRKESASQFWTKSRGLTMMFLMSDRGLLSAGLSNPSIR